MYHSVSERNDYFFTVSSKEFALQMQYLADKNYVVISLHDLVDRIKKEEPLNGEVVITFDDGYKDNFTDAFQVLKKHNFPATIFVTTDLIGKNDKRGAPMLSPEDLKIMRDSSLISVEPHTQSHPKLTQCSHEKMISEIQGSKQTLEELLEKKCAHFAYPYGNYNKDTSSIVAQLGFTAAVTVKEGTVTLLDNIFELPRNSIDQSTTHVQFVGKLSRVTDWYEKLKLWH